MERRRGGEVESAYKNLQDCSCVGWQTHWEQDWRESWGQFWKKKKYEKEKAEKRNAVTPKRAVGDDITKDTEEESKSLEGEQEAEQADSKEQAGVQSINDKQTESKTEEKSWGN